MKKIFYKKVVIIASVGSYIELSKHTKNFINMIKTETVPTKVIYINYNGNDWIEGSYFAFRIDNGKLFIENFIGSRYVDKDITFLENIDTIETVIQKIKEYSTTGFFEVVKDKEHNRTYKKVFTKNIPK